MTLRRKLTTPGAAASLVLLAAALAYANSLANDFAFDDWWIIWNNPRVHQLRDLGLIFGKPYWPFDGQMLGLYRPLTMLSFAAQWVVSDGSAWLFHLVNVLMHAGVSVLVLFLVRRFASAEAALVGALVFAVHPVHTEAVANIVGQAELWVGLCVVGACLVFLARPPEQPVSLPRLLAIAALYAVGLLAKEHSIVLPGLLVALEAARSPLTLRDYLRRHVGWIVPSVALLAAVAGAYLAVRYQVLGGAIAGSDAGPQFPFLREEHRVFSALRAWPEYMRLLFYPVDLSADYAPGVIMPVEHTITPMMLLGAVILAGLVGLAAATPWHPRLGLAPAWFLVAILPVSNLLFPIGVLLAERVLYLPSVGLSLALAFVWDALVLRPAVAAPARRRTALLLATGVVLAFTALTVARNPVWKTSETVVDSVIRDHPESYRAQYNAGVIAAQAGDTAQAIYHWELAVRMWDRDAKLLTNIGSFYLAVHQYERARQLLRPAFELHDDLVLTVTGLAVAELGVGNARESLRVAEYGLTRFGPRGPLFDVRGRALMALGQPARAAGSWRSAIRYGSNGWVQWGQLANALSAMDSTGAAVAALDTAILRATREGVDPSVLVRLDAARARLAP